MTRQALAERLEQRAQMCCPYVDQNAPNQEVASRAARNNADLMVMLREAAEWLRRGCETCRYQAPAGQWIAEPCCARVSIPGHPVAIVTCASLGNGCHAWEGRARS